jgi:RNA polymerase sigma-70 factor (ECF subfamily)
VSIRPRLDRRLPERLHTEDPMRNELALSTATATMPTDDLELVRLLQRGDHRAFHRIVQNHQHKVYRLSLRITRDEATARDVVQDAFLQVFRKIGQFQGESAFSTWLHRITVNAALMRLRSPHHRHETSFEDASPRYGERGELAEPIDDWSAAVDDVVIRRDLCAHAARAVDALPAGYRSVFVLRELEDMSTQDVAAALDITVAMVKTRLHRARLALRKKLSARIELG